MKRIGVLTSGGDAPGMNAAVRAVVRSALENGMEVYGIKRGYRGLVNDDMELLNRKSVSGIIQRGGTVLCTARCLEFKEEEGQKMALKNIKKRGIDGIIAIGGDGTFQGARVLSEKYGVHTIGIPGTIDNDLAYTDFTIGFDTACNTVLYCVNNIRDTMSSHERLSIVEVMGRHCGDIALYSGIASGAEVIIIPEVKIEMEEVLNRISESKKRGKTSNIIILAEGAGKAADYAKIISDKTGMTVKSTVLGHIQRGGAPTMVDRVLASRMGHKAVELIANGIGNRVIGIVDNKIIDKDICEALNMKSKFNIELYKTATELGM